MSESNRTREEIQLEALNIEQIAKIGAQQMLATALEAEVQHYLDRYADMRTTDRKQAVARNGYHV